MFGIRDTFYGFAIAFSTFKNTEVWLILYSFYNSFHVIIVIFQFMQAMVKMELSSKIEIVQVVMLVIVSMRNVKTSL